MFLIYYVITHFIASIFWKSCSETHKSNNNAEFWKIEDSDRV